jgi:hypothetical protein
MLINFRISDWDIARLIERAAALTTLEAEVCEVCRPKLAHYIFDTIPVWAICFAFEVNTEEDRKAFVPCALSLKSKSVRK